MQLHSRSFAPDTAPHSSAFRVGWLVRAGGRHRRGPHRRGPLRGHPPALHRPGQADVGHRARGIPLLRLPHRPGPAGSPGQPIPGQHPESGTPEAYTDSLLALLAGELGGRQPRHRLDLRLRRGGLVHQRHGGPAHPGRHHLLPTPTAWPWPPPASAGAGTPPGRTAPAAAPTPSTRCAGPARRWRAGRQPALGAGRRRLCPHRQPRLHGHLHRRPPRRSSTTARPTVTPPSSSSPPAPWTAAATPASRATSGSSSTSASATTSPPATACTSSTTPTSCAGATPARRTPSAGPTWAARSRTFQYIHADNMLDLDGTYAEDGDHIGQRGALRLAKAMWWMLARMAGWDGLPPGLSLADPDGGEEWPVGRTRTIRWTATGWRATSPWSCYRNGAPAGTLGTPAAASGSFEWAIPAALPSGFHLHDPGLPGRRGGRVRRDVHPVPPGGPERRRRLDSRRRRAAGPPAGRRRPGGRASRRGRRGRLGRRRCGRSSIPARYAG